MLAPKHDFTSLTGPVSSPGVQRHCYPHGGCAQRPALSEAPRRPRTASAGRPPSGRGPSSIHAGIVSGSALAGFPAQHRDLGADRFVQLSLVKALGQPGRLGQKAGTPGSELPQRGLLRQSRHCSAVSTGYGAAPPRETTSSRSAAGPLSITCSSITNLVHAADLGGAGRPSAAWRAVSICKEPVWIRSRAGALLWGLIVRGSRPSGFCERRGACRSQGQVSAGSRIAICADQRSGGTRACPAYAGRGVPVLPWRGQPQCQDAPVPLGHVRRRMGRH